jgi:hypothetical protein
MNIARTRISLTLAMSTLLLAAACGGGGDDEAGSFTALSISPAKVTVTGGTGSCPGAGILVAKVFVYGGTAPYRIDNANPDLLFADATVSDRGGSFQVTTLGGGCLGDGPIVVRDKLERNVTMTVVLAKGA